MADSPTRAHDGALHRIADSTGLKISGAGEWHAHRQKSSKARRQWEAACRRGLRRPHRGREAYEEQRGRSVHCRVPARTGQLSDPTFHCQWGLRYSVGEVVAADIKIVIPPRRGADAFGRRRGHVGAAERDPRDDLQCRAPRLLAGVTVSTTGFRREFFLQVQAGLPS